MARRYQYQNTRQWVRLPVSWYVKYGLVGVPGPEALAGSLDVSAGGLRLTTRERVPEGARLTLKINVPPLRRTIPAVGRVVRVRPAAKGAYEWGIVFEELAEPDRAELNRAIEHVSGRSRLTRHRGAWWRAI